jgi:transposase-like protein
MIALTCRRCESTNVIRYGKNISGTQQFRCKNCGKTFVLNPQSPRLSAEKEAAIEAALAERISQRGIARTLGVSRDTIRAVRKKKPPPSNSAASPS